MTSAPMKKLWRRSLRCALAIAFIGFAASWFVAGTLVAPSRRVIGPPPQDLSANSIQLESDSGAMIAGWHLNSDRAEGVIVLLHGIRGSRLSMLGRGRELFAAGYSVILVDLQAHGESGGENITIGHLEKHDVLAAVAFARKQHPAEPIGLIGVSLGGASALLAGPLGIDAMVVESVYPELDAAVRNRVSARLGPFADLPTALLLWQLKPRLGIDSDQLRPIDALSRVGCPILIAGGLKDLHTTAEETKQLFSRASEPKELWMVPGLGHEDLFEGASEEYREHVFAFLDREMGGAKKIRSFSPGGGIP